jgi:hypothetical protein
LIGSNHEIPIIESNNRTHAKSFAKKNISTCQAAEEWFTDWCDDILAKTTAAYIAI